MSQRPESPYTSPLSGEFRPITDAAELRQAFEEVSANTITVPGDRPAVVAGERDGPIHQVALSAEHGMHYNVLPQSLTLSAEAAATLEGLMEGWFGHYPIEPTLARTEFGQPLLLTRFDGMFRRQEDGRWTIGVCEFDDVPTGFNAVRQINPTTGSYSDAVAAELAALGVPLHSAFLPEDGYVYPHDDRAWLAAVDDARPGISVIPRARKTAPGFAGFIDQWTEHSIVGGRLRDNKWPLAPLRLGAVASNPTVALEVASAIRAEQGPPVFLKASSSSRTEAGVLVAHKKLHVPGSSTPSQAEGKFQRAGVSADTPIILQPFHQPPTMADLGLRFENGDGATLASFQAGTRNEINPELAIPGQESNYHILFRVVGVVLPNDPRPRIVGGVWMARPNNAAIIHGTSDAVTGPILVEGLKPYESK